MRTPKAAPTPAVRRALLLLGADLTAARLRRRLPAALVAERAGISRQTVAKIERGDAGVAIGAVAAVLLALGMLERLQQLAAPELDGVGMAMAAEQLPKRVRLPKRIAS